MHVDEIQLHLDCYKETPHKLYVLDKNIRLIKATLDLYLRGLEIRITNERRVQWPNQLQLQVSIIFSQKSIVQKGICPHTKVAGLTNRKCETCGLYLTDSETAHKTEDAFLKQAFERINALAWLMNLELTR